MTPFIDPNMLDIADFKYDFSEGNGALLPKKHTWIE